MSGRSKRPTYVVKPIGFVRSSLKRPEDAPKQGEEGAPDAWVEVAADVAEGLEGIAATSVIGATARPAIRAFISITRKCEHPRGRGTLSGFAALPCRRGRWSSRF
jgi:hypothetical protein